jgi:hypothetical protein
VDGGGALEADRTVRAPLVLAEALTSAFRSLPLQVSLPGWILAGLDAEILAVQIEDELESLAREGRGNTPGTDEIRSMLKLSLGIRDMVAHAVSRPEKALRPANVAVVRRWVAEANERVRRLPIRDPSFFGIVHLLSAIDRDLEAGDAIVTARLAWS